MTAHIPPWLQGHPLQQSWKMLSPFVTKEVGGQMGGQEQPIGEPRLEVMDSNSCPLLQQWQQLQQQDPQQQQEPKQQSPRDVEGWESGFEMLPHRVPSGSNSPLSGFVEGFLNGVFVDPAKIGP